MREARHPHDGDGKVGLWTVLGVSVALLVLALSPYVASFPTTLGSDWTWYRDGPDRMVAGAPLYDPAMLRGPFDYIALGERWNMAPWALPFILAVYPFGKLAWWLVMSEALVVALLLSWPRLPFPRGLLLGIVILISPPFYMAMLWGNLEPLVVLGVALWFVGQRRDCWWLQGIGIALAGIKVLPAIPLIAWSTLRDRAWRPTALAAVPVGLFSVPAFLYSGPGVLADFVRLQVDIVALDNGKNLSPMKLIDPIVVRVVVVAALAGALALRREVAIPLMLLLVGFLVPNLYATWFLVPMVAALATLRAQSASRAQVEVAPGPG